VQSFLIFRVVDFSFALSGLIDWLLFFSEKFVKSRMLSDVCGSTTSEFDKKKKIKKNRERSSGKRVKIVFFFFGFFPLNF